MNNGLFQMISENLMIFQLFFNKRMSLIFYRKVKVLEKVLWEDTYLKFNFLVLP